jgi:hypothetical protein
MSEAPSDQPHWSIPHVVGIFVAVVVYIAIYAVTGLPEFLLAFATGAVSLAGTWFYLFVHLPRRRN